MIADIEKRALERLAERWPIDIEGRAFAQFDIGKDFQDINQHPAIAVATESIGLRRNADGSTNFSPVFSFYLVFKNVARPDQRRAGIYPMVSGVVALLAGETFGLGIEPLLPVSAQEVYHEQLKAAGQIGYRLQFKTDFDVSKIDENDALSLIKIAINYYDGVTEDEVATDEITVGGD